MKNLVKAFFQGFVLGSIISFAIILILLLINLACAGEPDYTKTIDPVARALYAQTGSKDFVEMMYKASPNYIKYSTGILTSGYQILYKKQIQYKYKLTDRSISKINVTQNNAFLSWEYSL